jgi:NAD(P)-dependent dehydrogenase (short-subunit alcohol dehydrogenase family)
LRSFGRTLASELAPRGIRVNTISPGPIKTPIFDKLGLPAEEVQQFETTMSQTVALKRFGTPDEIATAAVFLGSKESSYMTGAELIIDGGYAEL